jgi:signal transduction histidine kinase
MALGAVAVEELDMLRRMTTELADEVRSLRRELERERARHARDLEQARLDGAVRTARRITHELRNVLSPVAGYGELLATRTAGDEAVLADRLKRSALEAARILARLDRIKRYREVSFGGEVMLDLEASAEQSAVSARNKAKADR